MDGRQPGSHAAPADGGARAARGGRRSPLRTAFEMLGLGPPPPDGHRFHALISYSHATDQRLATALQRGLQRFARPWYRTRALHVFRDNASLAANPHLWRSVQAGLDESQHFILLASRDAAQSPWVARECAYWRNTKSIERLLIVLTDGEIAWNEAAGDFDRARTDALPEPLYGAFAGEPRWIDLRWAAAERDLTLENSRFREAIAELGAPLHGLPRDEFDSIEVRERRRAVRLARGATAALALLLVAATVAAILALRARNEAAEQARVAESRALAVQARDEFGSAGVLSTPRPDLGVLLALESYRLAPTEQARGAVLGALEATDRIAGYLHSAGGPIEDLAYSPDGSTIAVETGNAGIELWSAKTLRQVGVLRLPAGTLTDVRGDSAMAFSPHGTLLAVAGVGRIHTGTSGVAVWRVRTRHLLGKPLTAPGSVAEAVAFAPSGGLVIGTADGIFRLWNAARGRDLADLPLSCAQNGRGFGESLDVSATATVVAGCPDGSAWVWRAGSAPTPAPVRLAPPASATKARVAISPDGSAIAAGYDSGEVAAWTFTVATGAYQEAGVSPSLGDGAVQAVRLAPGGAHLVAIYVDGQARVWAPGAGRALWSYESTPILVHGLSWSPDGHTLAVGGDDGLGVLWRAPGADGQAPPPDLGTVLDDRSQSGGPVVFGAGGTFLAAAEPDAIELWDPRTSRRLGPSLPGSAGAVRLAGAPGELAAVIGANAPVLRVWDVANPRAPRRAGGPLATGATSIGGIALDAAGDLLAAAVTLGDGRSGVELWELRTRRMRFVPTRGHFANSVAFDPQAKRLAVGESFGVVETIDYGVPRPRPRTLVAEDATDGAVLSIAVSADGQTIAASDSGIVKLLDATSGRLAGTPFRGPDAYAVTFSPDGRLLAIADLRGRIQLLDLASEEPFGVALPAAGSGPALANETAAVIDGVAFSDDGALLAAGGSGPVTIWNRLLWTSDEYAQRRERLCSLVGRNLTALEWRTYLPARPYRRTCPRWPAGH